MKKVTKDWLKTAEDDFLIIEKIADTPELSHRVAYHAQQVVEKGLKAVIEEFELGFIKTHSLEVLYGKAEKVFTIVYDKKIVADLESLYIDARYPTDIGLLPDGLPSVDDAKKFKKFAEKVFLDIKFKLQNK